MTCHRDGNRNFSRFVEHSYRDWIQSEKRPAMSPDLFPRWIFPRIDAGEKVVFILIDSMRIDQWLIIEPMLAEHFRITRDYYFSILPTATPYARNAIFSGYISPGTSSIISRISGRRAKRTRTAATGSSTSSSMSLSAANWSDRR